MGNARGDMQLNQAVEDRNNFSGLWMDDRRGSGLFAIDSALPGVLRTFVAVAGGLFACGWQEVIAIKEQIARNVGQNIGEEWEHKDLGIVKDVSPIPETGQALGGDTIK